MTTIMVIDHGMSLSVLYIQNPIWFNSQDHILFKKYHDLPSTTSCEGSVVVFVRNSPEYSTPWTQSESNSATYIPWTQSESNSTTYKKRKFGTLRDLDLR
jgi:hypothetical protein